MNKSQLKITALSIPDVVKLLKRGGSRTASEEAVKFDIENGAPVNSDGTVNLVFYAAWLVKETSDNAI